MAGIADDSNGFDVFFGDNVDFSGGFPPSAKVLLNGQLLIGSTALPHIRVNTLTSSDSSVTITNGSGTINLQAGGAVPTTFVEDTGTAVPVANILNVLGQKASTVPVMDTIGASNTINIENRTWNTQYVVDPSSTVGLKGTFTTIQSAITQAITDGGNRDIFIRPGTYTENLTLSVGINLVGFLGDATTPQVTIVGKATLTTAGTVSISNIRLQTTGDYFLAVTGTVASIVNLTNCFLNCSNNTGINFTTSSPSAQINISACTGDIGAANVHLYDHSSAGILNLFYSQITATGATLDNNVNSAGNVNIGFIKSAIRFGSSTTGGLIISDSIVDSSAQNLSTLTFNGSGTNRAEYCRLSSGTAATISVGGTATIEYCTVISTNSAPIGGSGTVKFQGIAIEGTGGPVINTTTQTPLLSIIGARQVNMPAGNYTTLASDYFIGATTTANRAITLVTSPVTGQLFRIKDITGTGATHNITITPAAGTIDGAATFVINTNFGSADVIYNGTEWSVV